MNIDQALRDRLNSHDGTGFDAHRALGAVLDQAATWAALAPAGDWGESMSDTVLADAGRAIQHAIAAALGVDAQETSPGEQVGPCPSHSPETHSPCALPDRAVIHRAGHEGYRSAGERAVWATNHADHQRWGRKP